jgi:hypothetical protein
MTPVIRAALPKAGFSSTISGVVRDAPISSGGLGVLDLFYFMGTERTAIMLSQCWQGTPTEQLFITSIVELALDTGLYGPLWQQPLFHQYSNWNRRTLWCIMLVSITIRMKSRFTSLMLH